MILNQFFQRRYVPESTWNEFDIEITDDLYSLWSNIHPAASVFEAKYRGRQYLAICLCAGAMATIYRIDHWNVQLMDYIVIEGDRWFGRFARNIDEPEYEVKLEDFCSFNSDKRIELTPFMFNVQAEMVVVGHLYGGSNEASLSGALSLFFSADTKSEAKEEDGKQRRRRQHRRKFGVLQCWRKVIGFGRMNGDGHDDSDKYFMYDCQSMEGPIFWPNQGAAYVLFCATLQRLLHCIVLTLAVPCYNVPFGIHAIEYRVGEMTNRLIEDKDVPVVPVDKNLVEIESLNLEK